MKNFIRLAAIVTTSFLVGCGGGGGSSGTVASEYKINLQADKTRLPINLEGVGPGQGVNAPFTTVLHVNATVAGAPIPGGEEIFGCNVAGGLNSGSLYYLDGDEEHETEIDDGNGGKIRIPNAYRSITLGSNAGGNSFHFHAGNSAGTVRITCSVTDPRDQQQKSATIDITVGGGAGTGMAASVQGIALYPTLGIQNNTNNLRTSTAINAYVWDDANQPVRGGANADLQVSIMSAGAVASGARLLSGQQQGSVVWIHTTGGVGQFSLSSGTTEGPILLELKTDRSDGDVTNGIQDPVVGLLVVNATEGTASQTAPSPLAFGDIEPPSATNGLPYAYALSATGGVAPYTWSALGGLPSGIALSASGLLSGTPTVRTPGEYQVAVRVVDSRGVSLTGNFTLTVAATAGADPVTDDPLSISLAGCGTDVNAICELPGVPVGAAPEAYQFVLSASGGGTGVAAWALETPGPAWLALTTSGILHNAAAVPGTCGPFSPTFFIKVTKGGKTAMRRVRISGVTGPAGTC